jgi:hypothetical protein
MGDSIKQVLEMLNNWHWSLIEIFWIGYFALTSANTFFLSTMYVLTLHL